MDLSVDDIFFWGGMRGGGMLQVWFIVVSIDLIHAQISRFRTTDYIGSIERFLFVTPQLVKKRTMENKTNISLGSNFPLFAKIAFFGQKHFESILTHGQSYQKSNAL